jgi:hypothetical protein
VILLLYLPPCLFLRFSLLLHLLELLQRTLNTKTNTKMLKKSIERQRKRQRIAQWKYSNIVKKNKFKNSLLSSGTQQGRRGTRKRRKSYFLLRGSPESSGEAAWSTTWSALASSIAGPPGIAARKEEGIARVGGGGGG